MGQIVIGRKKQKTVDMGGVTIAPNSGVNVVNKGGMTAEKKAQEDAREKRLAEIMTLPVEERLPLLLEDGFTEEAQKLSEELAQGKQEHADDGTGEDNTGHEETVGGEGAELNENGGDVEPEKKKVGRPKKSEE